jgi:ATP-dependent DNA helicase RecQ
MLKKLDDMVNYCQLHACRRQFLMQYFDELSRIIAAPAIFA